MNRILILASGLLLATTSCKKDIQDIFSSDIIKINKEIEFKGITPVYKNDNISADYVIFNRASYKNSSVPVTSIPDGTGSYSYQDTPYVFMGSSLKFEKDVKYHNAFFGVKREILKNYSLTYFNEFGEQKTLTLEKGKSLFYVYSKQDGNKHFDYKQLVNDKVINPVDYIETVMVMHFVTNTTTREIKAEDKFTFNYFPNYAVNPNVKMQVQKIFGTQSQLLITYPFILNDEENEDHNEIKISYNFKVGDEPALKLDDNFKILYQNDGYNPYYSLHKRNF